MSLVVADTTPLSDLLGALFSDVRVPVAVADELDRGGVLLGDWRQRILSFARIEPHEPTPLFRVLSGDLDEGEAAALALAGLIAAARPLLAQVRADGGLWVTEKLVAEIVKRVGE